MGGKRKQAALPPNADEDDMDWGDAATAAASRTPKKKKEKKDKKIKGQPDVSCAGCKQMSSVWSLS